jgi:hypothetical protein
MWTFFLRMRLTFKVMAREEQDLFIAMRIVWITEGV